MSMDSQMDSQMGSEGGTQLEVEPAEAVTETQEPVTQIDSEMDSQGGPESDSPWLEWILRVKQHEKEHPELQLEEQPQKKPPMDLSKGCPKCSYAGGCKYCRWSSGSSEPAPWGLMNECEIIAARIAAGLAVEQPQKPQKPLV